MRTVAVLLILALVAAAGCRHADRPPSGPKIEEYPLPSQTPAG